MNKYIEAADKHAKSLISYDCTTQHKVYRINFLHYDFCYHIFRERRRTVHLQMFDRFDDELVDKLMSELKDIALKEIFAELRIKRHLDRWRQISLIKC